MRMKRFVSVLAAAVMVFGVTGCNAITIDGETENVSGEAAGNGSIGFSVSTLNNPFFVTLSEGAKEKAKTEGEKLIVVDAGDDAAKQTSDIEDLISKKYQCPDRKSGGFRCSCTGSEGCGFKRN